MKEDNFTINLNECRICPRNCRINRYEETSDFCGSTNKIKIASYGPHYGEEPELVGFSFSGTIFFSGCNLLCNFCQNLDISSKRYGEYYGVEDLAEIMMRMQEAGSANINLVTPTHFSPQIIEAILIAKSRGLNIPAVHNGSGYEKVDTLKKFEGSIDIYMPDLKFVDPKKSGLFAAAPDYFKFASKGLLEMHRQAGDLVINRGIAKRGVIIRHLVLPNNQSDTKEIIDFIAENLGVNTYLNLMDQYRPVGLAHKYKKINRGLSEDEILKAVNYAKRKGFKRPGYLYDY